jgi:hypothetical protein
VFFCFTALIAAPLHIQLTNQFEFSFTTFELFEALLPAFLACLAVLLVLLFRQGGHRFDLMVSLLFTVSLLLWLQGNILVWDYGALDGRKIDWWGMWPLGVLDLAIWAVAIFTAIRYSGWVSGNLAGIGSVALILVQCISLYISYSNQVPVDRYTGDVRQKYVLSRNQNVIIIVLDAFQSDIFQQVIDREPELKDVFEDFVYFRNAVSGFRQSFPSVPNMLTATWFDNSRPMWEYVRDAYSGDSSLPRFLTRQGFRSEVYEHKAGMYYHPEIVTNAKVTAEFAHASPEIMRNIDVTLFRYLPHFFKRLVYNNQLWLLSRWFAQPDVEAPGAETPGDVYHSLEDRPLAPYFNREAMKKLSNVREANSILTLTRTGHDAPVFKFYHMLGTHLPIRMDRDFNYVEPEETREALNEMSVGVIRMVDLILNRFRELGIYEEALIILTADHGIWGGTASVYLPDHILHKHGGSADVPRDALPELKGTALPLVLIKRPGASGRMITSDAPVQLADIPKTVVTELGFDGSHFPGESMFELAEDQQRSRRVHFSTFDQNPSYSEPYRSTMTVFDVDGFSWLDSSWRKTGICYPPADQLASHQEEAACRY